MADRATRTTVRHAVRRLDLPIAGVTLAAELHVLGGEDRPLVCFVPGGATDPARVRPVTSPWERQQLGHLARAGCDALTLNFPGVGRSTGELSDNTLRRRRRWLAALLARAGAGRRGPLVLVGCSMGAHVAVLLSREVDVAALALVAPAAYGPGAEDEPFGAPLRAYIRRPGSWRDSPAFAALEAFAGDALLLLPTDDDVIPAGVTAAWVRSARDATIVWLPGASHHVLRSERPVDARAREDVCARISALARAAAEPSPARPVA